MSIIIYPYFCNKHTNKYSSRWFLLKPLYSPLEIFPDILSAMPGTATSENGSYTKISYMDVGMVSMKGLYIISATFLSLQ